MELRLAGSGRAKSWINGYNFFHNIKGRVHNSAPAATGSTPVASHHSHRNPYFQTSRNHGTACRNASLKR
jgi:hypothetical protein